MRLVEITRATAYRLTCAYSGVFRRRTMIRNGQALASLRDSIQIQRFHEEKVRKDRQNLLC